MGVIHFIIQFHWIFHYKPSSYGGTPMTMDPPYGRHFFHELSKPMDGTLKMYHQAYINQKLAIQRTGRLTIVYG